MIQRILHLPLALNFPGLRTLAPFLRLELVPAQPLSSRQSCSGRHTGNNPLVRRTSTRFAAVCSHRSADRGRALLALAQSSHRGTDKSGLDKDTNCRRRSTTSPNCRHRLRGTTNHYASQGRDHLANPLSRRGYRPVGRNNGLHRDLAKPSRFPVPLPSRSARPLRAIARVRV